ncbi:MAG TPA: polysaccharide biosynthesis protein, partial [Methylophilaceae bacterium]|nr:polysaccharide biosynthesis protein [Methylophilaceae bacterium]
MPSWRASMALSHDTCVALIAWILAYLLRFNFVIPSAFVPVMWQMALWVIPLQAFIFIGFGLYRGVWRFASIPDLQRILMAILAASLAVTALLYMFKPVGAVPRSVLILDPLLLILMMGGSRFAYRAWKEHSLYSLTLKRGEPVLVLGAGDAAIALLKDLARSEEWRVIGLLDDDQAIHGRELLGVKVLGEISQLPGFADALGVHHAIIAMPSAAHQTRRRAVELANQSGLAVLTVPAFDDLISGKVSVSQIRRVEVEDLLGREPVKLDDEGLHGLIGGRVVLVSGAGGSIGSELCRQIAKYQPGFLICLELSEFALYRLEQEFANYSPQTKVAYVMGDVKNEKRMKTLLKRYQPAIVFHAAAYKHVPLMENENVAEALSNNVVGTYTLAKVCKEADVEKFVLISTDKAVNPTNVMGASKRLAEMVCQGLQEGDVNKTKGTRFVIVRFGN